MKKVLGRRLTREQNFTTRMRRGIRAGFAVVLIIAVAVAILVESVAADADSDLAALEVVEEQRFALMELRADLSELVDVTDPRDAAEHRLAVGVLMHDINARQVDLLIVAPSAGSIRIDFLANPVSLTEMVHTTLDSAQTVIDRVSSDPSSAGVGIALQQARHNLELLQPAFQTMELEHTTDLAAAASKLRFAGRIIVVVALLAAVVRLFVLGRPLLNQLLRIEKEHEESRQQHQQEGVRRDLASRLAEGLETAESEAGVCQVVERALGQVAHDHPAELLLADSSKARLSAAATNTNAPAPGCGVQSPWSCPAVRRAVTMHYPDSDSVRACPHLADRQDRARGAVCVPVSFMGDAMGVLHVTGEAGWEPTALEVERLEILAGNAAVRLGSIRSFMKAEIQASTDALTGLANRRATEDFVGDALGSGGCGSVAIADLDHFKRLNDSLGHEAGDRALRMFADVVRDSLRDNDWSGRWGGEEFVIYLPELSARESVAVLDRVRENLASVCARAEIPEVTVSIGVVDTNASRSLEELVAMADDCLYFAKENGRDQVVVGPVPIASESDPTSPKVRS